MLIWARVDQKLIHGQISVAWIPHLKVDAIVVADSDTAEDLWAQKVMTMGLPPEVKLTRFAAPKHLAGLLAEEKFLAHRVMVIFKEVAGVFAAVQAGLNLKQLNLGNQACQPSEQNIRLGDTFYLGRPDFDTLIQLQQTGLEIFLQAVPSDKKTKLGPKR